MNKIQATKPAGRRWNKTGFPELRAFNPDDLADVRRAFDTATPASSPQGWLAVLYQFEFWWGERLSRRSPAKADPREPARQ